MPLQPNSVMLDILYDAQIDKTRPSLITALIDKNHKSLLKVS